MLDVEDGGNPRTPWASAMQTRRIEHAQYIKSHFIFYNLWFKRCGTFFVVQLKSRKLTLLFKSLHFSKSLRVGESRWPWSPTFSPSLPNISFFLFRQPWATTISPSVPPHLTLPGKTTFLNGIFRAFKVWS